MLGSVKIWHPAVQGNKFCSSGEARGFHFGWGRSGVRFCEPAMSGDGGCSVAEAGGGKGNLLTGVSPKRALGSQGEPSKWARLAGQEPSIPMAGSGEAALEGKDRKKVLKLNLPWDLCSCQGHSLGRNTWGFILAGLQMDGQESPGGMGSAHHPAETQPRGPASLLKISS